ncbi:ATP-binding protein [Nocardioides coralli]|uniref:ATP-binding protein n=1 Tax=Nocardioides coralli TaxID=2872154 RepID=UPI001CA3D94C|nr:ATP-binding protein [Nocardioides coralli]QZY28345.1 PAS domain S-box protein [Nocardioides coralli]
MAIALQVRPAALLLAVLAVGWMAVASRPEQVLGSEMWPAGLAAAVVFSGSRRAAPYAVVLVGLTAIATFWLGGRPLDFALLAGPAVAAEAAVVAWILTRRGAGRPRLRTRADLRVLLVAVLAGALVAGVVLGVGAAVLADRSPLLTALGTVVGHTSSALVLLPLLLETDRHPGGSRTERWLRWLVLLLSAAIVFVPHDFPAVLFLVIPVLGWTAVRGSLVEAQLQLLAVTTVGTVLTSFGFGPLAEVRGRYALPEDVSGIVLQSFLISCALVVIPLSLSRSQQLGAVERAEGESDLFRRLIDSAHVAIIGTDEIGRVTLFNPGAERLLGYRADDVMGEFTTIFHTRDAVSEKASELGVPDDFMHVALAMAEPENAEQHMRFRRQDGTERTHAITLSRVHDATGRVTGYVATSQDVTDELAAREALVESLEAERQAVERLQEVDRVKDTFVSSVSHELRTPITSIVGYLEMLLEGEMGPLSSAQTSALTRVDANSKRLLSLIDELLTLSRMHERGTGEIELVDLREVARTAYDVVAPSIAGRALDASLVVPEQPVLVSGNAEMLERMLLNLLGNAVKFTHEGAVSLWLQVVGQEAVLSVRDTGIGIPVEEQQHLFSRFFRSSLAQRHAIQGSGLGLSIALSVVEAHAGSIEVTSSPGEGTTFRVRLPVATSGNPGSAAGVVVGRP